MVRAAFYDEKGLKKGAWSKEEDDKLRDYILRYGHWNWRELPKFAGLSRCGKSCRLRWMNYLRPDLKHGNFTKEEDHLIFQLHQHLGTKWSAIASKMPGRTDNEIKNYWHAHLKKRLGWTAAKNNENPSSSSSSSLSPSSSSSSHPHGQVEDMEAELAGGTASSSLANTMLITISPPILESSPLSAETTASASASAEPVAGSWEGDINDDDKESSLFGRWDPVVQNEQGNNNTTTTYQNYYNCYDQISNSSSSTTGGDFWSEPFVVDDDSTALIHDGGDMMMMMMMMMGSYNSDQMQPYHFSFLQQLDDDDESLMYRVMEELPTTSYLGENF